MKQGKYGIQGEKFFEKFPNGAITCERVVAKCSTCGNYFDIPSLDLYIPKGSTIRTAEDNEKVWSVAVPLPDSDFVAPIDLEEKYELFEKYNHKCTKCGASVEIVENFENLIDNGNVKCLKCNDGIMEITDMIFWD